MVGDITDPMTQERIVKEVGDRQVNSVVSDISPHITGKWDVDQAVAMTLVAKVFDFALPLLCSGGWFVTKLFQGVGVEELIEAVKTTLFLRQNVFLVKLREILPQSLSCL